MKAKIVTVDVTIKQEWLDEIRTHIPHIEFDVSSTSKIMKLRVENGQMFGDFADMRKIINAPTGYRYRVYVISEKIKQSLGITSHWAAYDNRDRDGVLDFYLVIPNKKLPRTTRNNFTYDFTYLFIHEALHGKEQEIKREYLAEVNPDRTHQYSDEGRLSELIHEHFRISLMRQVIQLGTQLLNLLKK